MTSSATCPNAKSTRITYWFRDLSNNLISSYIFTLEVNEQRIKKILCLKYKTKIENLKEFNFSTN